MAAKVIRNTAFILLRRTATQSTKPGKRSCRVEWRNEVDTVKRWRSTASAAGIRSSPVDQTSREKANYEARVELAAAYRAAHYYQLGEGICNHLTMRAPGRNTEGDVMLLVPYGLQWKQVTASLLVGVDFKTGEKVEGEGVPLESAVCIHCPIHNIRYEQDGTIAVMHTHQPYTTALACLDEPAPFDETMCQNSMRFAGKIAYDWDYETLAYDMSEGDRLAKALGEKDILLMGHHGVLTVGRRVCDAFDSLYYMERASMVQIIARSSGARTRSAPPSIVKKIAEHDCYPYNAINHMDSIKKMLADEKPNYLD